MDKQTQKDILIEIMKEDERDGLIHDPNTFTTMPTERLYVWDSDDVKQLQEIAKQIHRDNAAEECDATKLNSSTGGD